MPRTLSNTKIKKIIKPTKTNDFIPCLSDDFSFGKAKADFIDDTMIWFLNSKLNLNLSCAKDFRNLISMVTLCINWRKLLALIISHYKKIGYNINVLQQTACLVVNPITVGNFAFLLIYMFKEMMHW